MADYAQRTADVNSLGVDDALLVVAMDDRTDYIWVSDSLDEITDDELDTILVEDAGTATARWRRSRGGGRGDRGTRGRRRLPCPDRRAVRARARVTGADGRAGRR